MRYIFHCYIFRKIYHTIIYTIILYIYIILNDFIKEKEREREILSNIYRKEIILYYKNITDIINK